MSSGKLLIVLMKTVVVSIVLVFPAILVYLFAFVFYFGEHLEEQVAENIPPHGDCEANSKSGLKGESRVRTKSGFRYLLKTPLNYSSEQAWPVLLVFSPAMGGSFMETFTGLTAPLTKAGFLIAYVDAVPMRLETIPKFAEIISDVNKRWCIDNGNIFVSGHSDGGTISQTLNFLPELYLENNLKIAGFISSAAGLQKQDLAQYACPSATKAFILHNTGDTHFPNFGSGTAQWWAECNECKQKPIDVGEGCYVYEGCKEKGSVKFCEQPGSHLKWPERHTEIIDFLKFH